ncbi:polyketide cyclase [Mumia zhuanghuii]|uniref:SRPBCC domain-containing protein n=2 Tax=Mumia TaxID=1546255 RepID=A0ABW1QHU7_9ACTN|nr:MULTISPECIES: SRPBCC domain-containing protein [Mumia]KAA1424765.1 polyketide cyclase [Mumia zhuanghuii]
MTIAPTGRREDRDGTDYLVYRRRFAAPIDDVWAAITDPDRLSPWIGTWEGDPESGEVTFYMTAEGDDVPGQTYTIDVCEKPRRLVTRSASPSGVPGDEWVIELDLDDDEGFTTLTFAQAMPDAETAASVGPGWDYYLDRMVASERGEDLDDIDFEQYLADQSEYYRGAFS